MNVEVYDYDGKGIVIDPESDMKERTVILIGKQLVKCNPRPAVIYVTGGKVDAGYDKLEELKAYCADNKLVFFCPTATDCDELGETYKYIKKNAMELNVLADQVSVRCLAECKDVAQELVDFMLDEFDAESDDAEEFAL